MALPRETIEARIKQFGGTVNNDYETRILVTKLFQLLSGHTNNTNNNNKNNNNKQIKQNNNNNIENEGNNMHHVGSNNNLQQLSNINNNNNKSYANDPTITNDPTIANDPTTTNVPTISPTRAPTFAVRRRLDEEGTMVKEVNMKYRNDWIANQQKHNVKVDVTQSGWINIWSICVVILILNAILLYCHYKQEPNSET